jgi:chaperonin cofactor prefoldin
MEAAAWIAVGSLAIAVATLLHTVFFSTSSTRTSALELQVHKCEERCQRLEEELKECREECRRHFEENVRLMTMLTRERQ